MNNPLVSIIVPCYNQGEYLIEALESVECQTYLNWECIVVDDGSTDNSKDIALSFCEKDNRFFYIYQENQGPSIARNFGIANSHGRFILPLDGDDKIHKNYVEQAASILNDNNEVKIVYCKAEFFGKASGEWKLEDYNEDLFLIRNCIFCTAMYRRTDYDKTRGYNSIMKEGLEDWEFWISMLELGGIVYKIPKVYFYYRIKEQSRNTDWESKIKMLYPRIMNIHSDMYIQQYCSLYSRYYNLRNSRFYSLFYWLREKEKKWIDFKVYIYHFLVKLCNYITQHLCHKS